MTDEEQQHYLQPWHELEPLLAAVGLCANHDEPLWCTRNRTADAKRLCRQCPVLAECREVVDYIEGDLGWKSLSCVWAAETPIERCARRTGA